ncbi:tetratricopeptide repeat protein [Reichenbachiella sp. MSK19-1]|uniref:tetratricopeptide repeat protein n=1 Tax=Reichenbachiella sp. MSK19-1 TaxID=1897631 RepID=UPI000E6CE804|nr:tetratricopeptide repeat protein [Reichenbachiella sp. MSK19-1]RJE72475.1 hypothetical protein BGP76_00385 [Reichenbachiella sp. MSK19-1]
MTRQITHRLCLIFLLAIGCKSAQSSSSTTASDLPFLITPIFIQSQMGDSTTTQQENQIREWLKKGDTLQAIPALNKLAMRYSNRVDYSQAYDCYWQALLLAEQVGDKRTQADSYNGLGILYSLYERRDAALDSYLQSLTINKRLLAAGEIDSLKLRDNYFALAIHFRYQNEVSLANAYLDSCESIPLKSPYANTLVKAERAYLLIQSHHYPEAEALLLTLQAELTDFLPSYLVIYHSLLGDLYVAWEAFAKAQTHYQLALNSAKTHLAHLNFVPDTYFKLSKVMTVLQNPTAANTYMQTAYALDQWLYSAKSPNNHFLLEIKDKYREEQERQAQIIQAQRLRQLEQEEYIWILKTVVLVVTLVLVGFAAIVWTRKIRRKHKLERAALHLRQQQEQEKNQAILEVKNKELTNTTLQIIAKDELLSEVKTQLTTLQKEGHSPEIRKLIQTIQLNKDQSWLAFEKQFAAVNNDFFDKLRAQFPELKPYDHKICALIKLDFSGKEMAQLLGISAESANTSRYRLRKRLRLKKGDNLKEFVDGL